MTQEEIQQRNEQIALMLGWDSNVSQTEFYPPYQFGGIKDLDDLMFNLDWNWLHEAVEFIEKSADWSLDCIHFDDKTTFQVMIPLGDINIILEDKKEAVFIAVSDFAKLHNEGKL